MAVLVARQPILDRSRRTCAYELLYRRAAEVTFDGAAEGDQATLSVLDASFFVVGIESLTGGHQAFVNFTRETLVKGYAASVPPQRLVVEVLEDILPDAEVLAACRALKDAGYLLALDDVITADVPPALLDLADIVKIDFQQTDPATRRRIARALRGRRLRLLAEKVETEQEVDQALAEGYELFQGFFFARPSLVSGREVRPSSRTSSGSFARRTVRTRITAASRTSSGTTSPSPSSCWRACVGWRGAGSEWIPCATPCSCSGIAVCGAGPRSWRWAPWATTDRRSWS
jgi:EAL and modified HD-GYP domain-containing signal transduction protein